MNAQVVLVLFLLVTSPFVYAYDDYCECDCEAEGSSVVWYVAGAAATYFGTKLVAGMLGFNGKGTTKGSIGSKLTSLADRTGQGQGVVNTLKSEGAGGNKYRGDAVKFGADMGNRVGRLLGGSDCECCKGRR